VNVEKVNTIVNQRRRKVEVITGSEYTGAYNLEDLVPANGPYEQFLSFQSSKADVKNVVVNSVFDLVRHSWQIGPEGSNSLFPENEFQKGMVAVHSLKGAHWAAIDAKEAVSEIHMNRPRVQKATGVAQFSPIVIAIDETKVYPGVVVAAKMDYCRNCIMKGSVVRLKVFLDAGTESGYNFEVLNQG
jgi:hypothetical protein